MKYTIDNGSMPAVIFQLEAGESLFSSAGGRRWAKGPIVTENSADGGVRKVFGRIFSGESILMSHYIAQGPSEIAFTPSFPGRIIVRELQAGESLICQKQSFLCATEGVTLSAHLQKKLSSHGKTLMEKVDIRFPALQIKQAQSQFRLQAKLTKFTLQHVM